MKKKEYAVTSDDLKTNTSDSVRPYYETTPDNEIYPGSPPGSGWVLVSSACNDDRIYWTWVRNKRKAKASG